MPLSKGLSMSAAALDSLETDEDVKSLRLNRSNTVSVGIEPSNLNPVDIGRRVVYEVVPFTIVHGMQFKERRLTRALSSRALSLTETAEVPPTEASKLIESTAVQVEKVIVTAPLCFAVVIAVISRFLEGYNTSVVNAPAALVFPGHSTMMWGLAVSAHAVGGPGGALLAGYLADRCGRRGALLIDAGIYLVGGLLLSLAPDIYWLILARFVIGFACGISSVLVPIYLGELAPPSIRGSLGTMMHLAMVTGILVADLLAFPFATPSGWRVLFGVTALLPVIQLACSPFLLESPRWLLARDESSVNARVIMKKLRGFQLPREVEMEVEHMLTASHRAAESPRSSALSPAGALLHLLSEKNVRTLLIPCLVLQVSQQLCGINAVFYYSTSFFDGLIDDPLTGTTLVAAINVVATYVALKLMDRCGRRTLVLWSAVGMFVSCLVVTAALYKLIPNMAALAAVMVYVFFFEIGMGPIPWLIVAEMFDVKYVATAMSLSSQTNWACNFLVGLGFPFINAALGPASFMPFAAVLLLTIVYTFIYLPETLGLTVKEIQDLANSVAKKGSRYMSLRADETEETKENTWHLAEATNNKAHQKPGASIIKSGMGKKKTSKVTFADYVFTEDDGPNVSVIVDAVESDDFSVQV